jgi:chaperonin GroES
MKLASVSETMAGESPSQNTPATTTLAVIEQGLKVFTAIYKRVFRSLKSEFGKLRRLNYMYLDEEEVYRVHDEENSAFREDYAEENYDIIPVADPTMASDAQRLAKAQALMGTIEINPSPEGKLEILEQFYEALQAPNIDKLLPKDEQGKLKMPEPPPDPKAIELQIKAVESQQESDHKSQKLPYEITKMEAEIDEIKSRTTKNIADAQDKPIMTALNTLTSQVAAMHNETKMEIEREKIKATIAKGAKDGTSTGSSGGNPSGGAAGVGTPPNNPQGAEILGGMQGVSGDPTIGGSNPVIDELGPNGAGDGTDGGGDQGTRPYPADTTRS